MAKQIRLVPYKCHTKFTSLCFSVNLDTFDDIEISDEAHAELNSYLVKSASAGANGLEFLSPGMCSSVNLPYLS